MRTVSQRGSLLPASPIRRLAPLTAAARARGVDVIPLNIGQPDLPLPLPFRDAVLKADLSILSYTPSDGELATRQAVTAFNQSRGLPCAPTDLIMCNGGSEAILLAFAVLADPGDEVLCPEPLYANYVTLGQLVGVKVKGVASTAKDGYRLPSLEALEAAVTPRTRAVLWSSPNNPTGTVYTRDELERLGTLSRKHDLYLIADEVYSDFFFGAKRAPSIRDLPDSAVLPEKVIVVDSASKRWASCGARLGWLYSRSPDVKAAVMRAAMGRLSPPMLSERMVQAAARLGDDYYEHIQAEYRRRRDTVMAGVEAIPGARAGNPEGAFYAFVELPVDDTDRFSEFLLDSFQWEGRTVAVAPGSGFYANEAAPRREIRLAYVLEQDRLKLAMTVLQKAVAAYNRRHG